MDIRNNYLFGTDIDLSKYGLGSIYQPKYGDFLNLNIDAFDFIKPFYLAHIFNYKHGGSIQEVGLLTFVTIADANEKGSNLVMSLLKSLELLYQTKEISFNIRDSKIVINNNVTVDNYNFNTLVEVVLDMTKTTIDYKQLENKLKSDDAIINEFERRKREYEEKNKKKNSGIALVDIINIIIHYQGNVDYEKVLGWTLYQIKNTYEVLIAKESNYIALFRQASMKFDIQEISNWQNMAKINETISVE